MQKALGWDKVIRVMTATEKHQLTDWQKQTVRLLESNWMFTFSFFIFNMGKARPLPMASMQPYSAIFSIGKYVLTRYTIPDLQSSCWEILMTWCVFMGKYVLIKNKSCLLEFSLGNRNMFSPEKQKNPPAAWIPIGNYTK